MKAESFETFRELGSYEIMGLIDKEPSAFNGRVRVRKYKITIEEIEEPIEVLQSRVQALWDKCENHHHWEPLQKMAASLGMNRLEHRSPSKAKGE